MKLKLVTLNLWFGGTMFDEIVAFLKVQDADVVVLQEAYNGEDVSLKPQYRSMQELRKRLGYPYDNFVADYLDFDDAEGKAQRGNAILSKFPITASDAVFFVGEYTEEYRNVDGKYDTCPRDLQHVALQTPAGEVNVFNIQGVWDLNGENYSPQRKHMAEVVIKAIEGKPNVIVAGDTNAKQVNQSIKDIEEHLQSVFGEELTSTFNMRHKDNPGYATAAVDAIFISPNIKVLEKSQPDVDLSDHLPLTATLEI
ncbi:MAG TPA: endonuclease/exonuclease/phosphatase family protein [Candidatus Saccharimonadales bacterium]